MKKEHNTNIECKEAIEEAIANAYDYEKSTVKVNQSLIKLKIKENQSKKRPSVLQKLEENKGKVDRYDKNKGEKAIKKDKGMEI